MATEHVEKTEEISISPEQLIARGARVRQLREILGLTIVEFAQLCACGESTVRFWEHARGPGLSTRGAKKIVSAIEKKTSLECDLHWLLDGDGPIPYENPTSNSISEEIKSFSSEENELKADIEKFNTSQTSHLLLCLQDDAMAPFFKKGDYIGGIKVVGEEINQLIGEICIVQTLGGQILLRKLYDSPQPGKYRLSAINPAAQDALLAYDTELSSAAWITRLWRYPPNTKK